MEVKDLRNLLEKSNNKLSIFADASNFLECEDLTVKELLELINEFLSDEQKIELFQYEHFKKMNRYARTKIIETIIDDEIRLKALFNEDAIKELDTYQIVELIKKIGDSEKLRIMQTPEFLEQYGIEKNRITEIIITMGDDAKFNFLSNKDFAENQLKLDNFNIKDIIESIGKEEVKEQLIKDYNLNDYQIENILETFSDKTKKAIILENKYGLRQYYIIQLISSMNTNDLVEFVKENKEFLAREKIDIYKIVTRLEDKKQIEFVSFLENMELDFQEKRKILVILRKCVKEKLDITNMPEEYKEAIQIETDEYDKIIIQLYQNLEKYAGLDDLILVNPMNFSEEEREKFLQLCDICPELRVADNLKVSTSSAEEYKNGEEWIESVFREIKEEWTDIQKVAYIDNAIGKRISYSPNIKTESFNHGESRALWKILNTRIWRV